MWSPDTLPHHKPVQPAAGHRLQAGRTRLAVSSLVLACAMSLLLLTACAGWRTVLPGDTSWTERLRFWARTTPPPQAVDLQILAPADDPDLQARLSATALAVLEGDPLISATVTVTSLTPRLFQQVAAGRVRPDVLVLTATQIDELVAAQQLAPLALSAPLTAALEPRLLQAGIRSGMLYCAPHSFHTLALFYNRDLFDQAEVAYPDAAWTWSDLRMAAAAVEELPTYRFMPFGLVLSPDISRWLPFLLQAAPVPPLDNPGAIFTDAAALQRGLDYVTALYTDTLAVTPGYFSAAWAGEVFGNGRAAMTVEGNWLVDYLAERYPDLRYGVAPLPAGESAATVLFPFCVAVGAHTAHAQLVPHVVQALLDVDVHAMAVPARPGQWAEWQALHPDYAAFVDQREDAVLWSGEWATRERVEAYHAIMRRVLDGELSVADAVAAFGSTEEP